MVQDIKSSWRATGLWPSSVAKLLTSPLVSENSNRTKETPNRNMRRSPECVVWIGRQKATLRKSVKLGNQLQQAIPLDGMDNPT